MRTQKRNKSERAFNLGYKAGMRGKSMSLCPYQVAETRGSWMGGWREGRDDMRNGFLDLEDL